MGELCVGVEDVEEAVGDAAVEGADRWLILFDGVAVGAVVEADRDLFVVAGADAWLKAECGERCQEWVLGGLGLVGCEFAADLASGVLDRSQAGSACGDRACEPAREVAVAAGCAAAGPGVGCDGPEVAGSSSWPGLAGAREQPVAFEALEMDAHAVGVQGDAVGEFGGGRWSSELAEQPKQVRSGRL